MGTSALSPFCGVSEAQSNAGQGQDLGVPRDVAGGVTEAMRTRVRGQGTFSLLPTPSHPSPLISTVFAFKRSSRKLCDPNQGQVVLNPGSTSWGSGANMCHGKRTCSTNKVDQGRHGPDITSVCR